VIDVGRRLVAPPEGQSAGGKKGEASGCGGGQRLRSHPRTRPRARHSGDGALDARRLGLGTL